MRISFRKGNRRFQKILGNTGFRAIFQNSWATLNWEGRSCHNRRFAIIGHLVAAVANDLLGMGDESEEAGHVQMVKFGGGNGRNQEEKKI